MFKLIYILFKNQPISFHLTILYIGLHDTDEIVQDLNENKEVNVNTQVQLY